MLTEHSPDDFLHAIGGGPIRFQRDASGKITGFLVSLDGQDFLARQRN
jgi:hypothetical protein